MTLIRVPARALLTRLRDAVRTPSAVGGGDTLAQQAYRRDALWSREDGESRHRRQPPARP